MTRPIPIREREARAKPLSLMGRAELLAEIKGHEQHIFEIEEGLAQLAALIWPEGLPEGGWSVGDLVDAVRERTARPYREAHTPLEWELSDGPSGPLATTANDDLTVDVAVTETGVHIEMGCLVFTVDNVRGELEAGKQLAEMTLGWLLAWSKAWTRMDP